MPEQIGVFFLFLAFVVFNLIAGAINRRRQRAAAEQEKQPPPERPPVRAPVPLILPPRGVSRPPSFEESAPPPAVVRTPAAPRRVPVRQRRRLELRRDELRRAIMLMTVLGPPRALEHEDKNGSGPR
jgi:hypothetical protein